MSTAPFVRSSWVGDPYSCLILSLVPLVHAQWPARQLDSFFPAWDSYLHGLIAGTWPHDPDINCTSVLEADLQADEWAPYKTVECLLDAFPEYRKSEMGVSAVALGLLPTILSLLGPSITDQAILAMRRPFLPFLLAAGSPAVNPQLRHKYTKSIKKRLPSKQAVNRPDRSFWSSREGIFLVSLIEHVAAFGAVLNIAILAYQLSVFTITSFSVRFGYLPAVWAGLSPLVHLGSYLALRLRVCVRRPGRERVSNEQGGRKRRNNLFSSFAESCAAEFSPCEYQQLMTLEWCSEDKLRFKFGSVIAWLLNFGIVVHIFGTLTLSVLLFISAADSIAIVARFVASTVVTQLVYTYELSGIKKTTFLIDSVSTSRRGTSDVHRERSELELIHHAR